MADLGFLNFDDVSSTPKPTTQELLAILTAEQELDILNGFAKKVKPPTA